MPMITRGHLTLITPDTDEDESSKVEGLDISIKHVDTTADYITMEIDEKMVVLTPLEASLLASVLSTQVARAQSMARHPSHRG